MINNTHFEELKQTDTKGIAFTLANSIRELRKDSDYHATSIALALSILDLQNKNDLNCNSYSISNLSYSGELKDIINKYINDIWNIVIVNLYKFTNNELEAFILFDNSFDIIKSGLCSTPNSINQLVCEILNLKNDDTVLELCSGKGGFAIQACSNNNAAKFTGVELNYVAREIAVMRLSLLSSDYNLFLNNAFEYNRDEKADKLFSNYPFMLRSPSLSVYKNKLANLFNIASETLQKASSDWVFNLKLISQMKDTGMSIAIMTNGSTWNAPDKNIRKFFVESGFVEAVISLPGKLFSDTQIPTTMIIMSKGNDKVRLIDATNICVKSKRNTFFSSENIEQIVTALKRDCEYSISVDKEQLSDNEYILHAARYLTKSVEIENGVEFESIIKKITRGSQLKAEDLNALKSNEVTSFQYVMLSNIDNGVVSIGDEQYLSEMPLKLEKYCIKNNSIILSKIGVPTFKSAVISIPSDKKLLANGNLFVIEIDETKADPYYIQAYFISNAGIAAFKNIYSGASIATISLENLKKMIIPLPSLEKQKEIGNKYAACIDELALLKKKFNKVIDKMQHTFDEEG